VRQKVVIGKEKEVNAAIVQYNKRRGRQFNVAVSETEGSNRKGKRN